MPEDSQGSFPIMGLYKEIPPDAYSIWGEQHDETNFAPVTVTLRKGRQGGEYEIVFLTAEHLYQMAKFLPGRKDIREKIRNAKGPLEAKMIAREYKDDIRSDWDEIRYKVMYGIMRMKVGQNQDLQEQLLETGDRFIYENADEYAEDLLAGVEDEEERDKIINELRRWGIYQGEGANWIGKILMDLREKLANGVPL